MAEKTGSRKPKVIIIGAGLAGLSAAVKLTKHGKFDVTVLEATDRVGGRVQSTWQFGNHLVELGANWIHGSQGNPVFKLAKKHNLLKKNLKQLSKQREWFSGYDENENFYTEHGEQIHHSLIDRGYKMYKKISDKNDKYARGQLSLDDPYMSLGDALDKDVKKEIDEMKLTQRERHLMFGLVEWFKIVECLDNACQTVNDISLRWFGEYEVLPGSYYIELGQGGFQSVVDVLHKGLPDQCIQYNKKVQRIVWDRVKGEGSEVKDRLVSIETTDGENSLADHVLVTCSLGYLKENVANLFQPAVPKDKKLAIEKLGFGTVDKIFLQFEKPFWDEGVDALSFVWDWEFPVSKAQVEHEGDTNLEMQESEEEIKNTWHKKVCGFETVDGHNDVLVGWIHGKEAEFVENMDTDEVKETCVKLLNKFTGKEIPKVKKMILTRWKSDEYARGSYSYISVGAKGPDVDTLAQPMYMTTENNEKIPQVLFAGEATTRKFISTTHGAFTTGEREAVRLINFYQQN